MRELTQGTAKIAKHETSWSTMEGLNNEDPILLDEWLFLSYGNFVAEPGTLPFWT